MTPASPRLPLEPLVTRHGGVSALARALGRDRSQVGKWRRRGVSLDRADAIAVALGLHPVEVWPEWYTVTEEAEAA
jgi:lambda repressor-like predicted transcriptional regulator